MAQQGERYRRNVNRFNKLIIVLQTIGISFGRIEILTATGRRTGQPRKAPVGVVPIAGERYIFQAYPNAAWVANVRAAATVNLARGRRSTNVRLVELPVEERGQLLRQQLQNSPPRAGKLLVKTGLVDDPNPDAIAVVSERIAVFRIEPA